MIPKIIHQIYFNLHNKEIEDIPLFKTSSKRIKELHPDYEYILWTKQKCDDLVKEKLPQYYDFYTSMRFDIQRIDYMRFVLLHLFGGIYADLDLIPIQKFDRVLNRVFFVNTIKGLVFTKWRNDNWKNVDRETYLVENYISGAWLETMSNNKASKTFYLTEDEL